jgi:hypothetical protein
MIPIRTGLSQERAACGSAGGSTHSYCGWVGTPPIVGLPIAGLPIVGTAALADQRGTDPAGTESTGAVSPGADSPGADSPDTGTGADASGPASAAGNVRVGSSGLGAFPNAGTGSV